MKRLGREQGFTLIELAIVCGVIGILSAIAIPNYAKTKARSSGAACVTNQRNLFVAATLYASDHGVADVVLNCHTLFEEKYISAEMADCLDSDVRGQDDYSITIEEGKVTNVTCDIVPDEHHWDP